MSNPFDNLFGEHEKKLQNLRNELAKALEGVRWAAMPQYFTPEVLAVKVDNVYSTHAHIRCGNPECAAEYELRSMARPQAMECPLCGGRFVTPIGWN